MKRLLILAALLAAGQAGAADRYASPTGTGSACTSTAGGGTPCSVSTAISGASCGDTVRLETGTYTAALPNPSVSCTSDNVLTIRSDVDQGATLALTSGSNGVLYVNGRNWITFYGFNIRLTATLALFSMRVLGGTGITFQNITSLADCNSAVSDFAYITASSDQITLDNVNVGLTEAAADCNYNYGACFSWDIVSNVTVKNSTCHDVRNIGQFNNASGVTVQDNTVYNMHNHGWGMVDVDTATVQRNVFYTTTSSAAETFISDVLYGVCVTHLNFRNNTIIGDGRTSVGFPYSAFITHASADAACSGTCSGGSTPGASCDLVATCGGGGTCVGAGPNVGLNADWKHNNNLYIDIKNAGAGHATAYKASRWVSGVQLVTDYNLYNNVTRVSRDDPTDYATLANWQAASPSYTSGTHDDNSIITDPTFADETNHDYRPALGSVVIDAGTDANCANTIVGAHCDIGAYEYGSGGAASPNTVKGVTLKGAVIR